VERGDDLRSGQGGGRRPFLPDDQAKAVVVAELALPKSAAQAVEMGAKWYDSCRAVGLLVRSVIVPEEHNLLLNPGHPDFERIRALPARSFRFDPGLLGQP
jgi:RES domain-containing protein